MRGFLMGSILIAGCYQPAVQSGVPCSVAGECPEGQLCAAGFCSALSGPAPGPDAAPAIADRDSDGLSDGKDNCPDIANRDQINEDSDGFGDACDPCPQIFDDTGLDSDGDRVGDLCDPNPGVHDTVWLYDGFHSGTLPPWSRSLQWTVVGDKLRAMAAGNTSNDGEYLFTPFQASTPPDRFSVTMTVQVEQMTGTNGDHSVGIEIWDANAKRGVDCFLDQNPAGSKPVLWLMDDFSSLNEQLSFAWTTGVEYRLSLARHGSTYACTVVGPGGSLAVSGTSAVIPQNGDAVDIWAYGATALYGSVQIIGTP